MKTKFSLLALFFTFCIWISVSAQVFQNDDLVISELEENVWVVETTDNTTMYIIEGTEKAILIDTGTKCKNLDEVVRKITDKPLYVVLTHFHPDHAGNIGFFDKVYMHPADSPLVDMLKIPFEGTIEYINDGDVFDLGGKKIEVFHVPGHTPGSIVLNDMQSGICYSGDAFGSGMVWLQLNPFSTMKTYSNSCARMEKLMNQGISKIYCGHYPYVKKAYDKSYIVAMRKLAEAIDDGKVTDAKPFEMKVSIGSDNPMIISDGTVSIVYDPDHIKF